MRRILLTTLLALSFAKAAPAATPASVPSAVSFRRDVAPILLKNCQTCHGPEKAKGGYRLDTFDRLLKPGSSGDSAVTPGRPDQSSLYQLVVTHDADDRMPKKADPLPPAQAAVLKAWIDEGAKFDGPDPAAAVASYVAGAGDAAPIAYKRPLPITALAFSPDGSELIVGGYHELTRWDAKAGKLVGRTPLPVQRVQTIAVDGGTGRIAVAGGTPGVSGELLLLDAGKGSTPRSLVRSPDLMLAARFSPDGSRLAAGGTDGTIRVFDPADGKLMWKAEPHADWVTDVAFAPDGRFVATASRDKSCRVFDAKTGDGETSYLDHAEPVYAIAYSADGTALFSAGRDRRMHHWSAADGKRLSQTGGFGGDVLRLVQSGDALWSGCADGKLRRHATNEAEPPKEPPATTKPAAKPATAPAAKKPEKPTARRLLLELPTSTEWVYSVALSEKAGLVAAGSQDGRVHVYAADSGKPVVDFVAAPR